MASREYESMARRPTRLTCTAHRQPTSVEVWTSPVLSAGTHRIIIEFTGSKNASSTGTLVGVDAMQIDGQLEQSRTRYEETDAKIQYSGSWKSQQTSLRSGGSWIYAKSGSVAWITFKGTDARLISSIGPAYGIATVSLDGATPVDVDYYAPDYAHQREVWAAQGLEDTTHTVTFRYTGRMNPLSSGDLVALDAVDLRGALLPASPSQLKNATRFENSDARIALSGAWTQASSSVRSGGSWAYSRTAGSTAFVNFTGTGIELISSTGSDYGVARVTLDGTEYSVDAFSSASLHKQIVWGVKGLANASHKLKIEYSGTKNPSSTGYLVGLDAVDVEGTLDAGQPVTSPIRNPLRGRRTGNRVLLRLDIGDLEPEVGRQVELDSNSGRVGDGRNRRNRSGVALNHRP